MSDRIAEIRKRHSKRSEIDQSGCYRLDGFTYTGSLSQSQEDVATLLAEVDRLRAANKQLVDGIDTITRRKQEENERLREALRDIERGDYSDPMCERTPEQRAREALEGKP